MYLRIKGVFKELRGFRILGSSNLRILVVAICDLLELRTPERDDYHRVGVGTSRLGASGASPWLSNPQVPKFGKFGIWEFLCNEGLKVEIR